MIDSTFLEKAILAALSSYCSNVQITQWVGENYSDKGFESSTAMISWIAVETAVETLEQFKKQYPAFFTGKFSESERDYILSHLDALQARLYPDKLARLEIVELIKKIKKPREAVMS